MGLQDELQNRARGAALGSLGEVLRSPLAQAAIRYWWAVLPVGYVAWRSYKKRSQNGGADPMDVIMDTAPVVSMIATLVLLNQALKACQPPAPPIRPAAARPAPQLPPDATIRDADFTPKEG